ncbi:MAG TPA: TolC family protein [Bryobacteraceae bacterium]|nr:TolC family protein [Bryobacteraceae bacterium]
MNRFFLFFTFACLASAEVHTLTLRQAIDLALKQSPDVILARLDQQKVAQNVNIARDPFVPKVFGGSGLAYTNGFPTSIDGAAPSIFQARTDMEIYNRPQRYQVAAARENERGAAIDVQSKQDDVAYRTALLYLDARQSGDNLAMARQQVEVLERVQSSVRARIAEGRALEIDNKRATVDVLRARQRVEAFSDDQVDAETNLALVLGFTPDDRVRPAEESLPVLQVSEPETALVGQALNNSNDVKRLESQMLVKGYEIRSYRSARLPQIDLVAQYALFATYNHFQDYFLKFQRSNGELGVSIKIPLLVGKASYAYAAQAEADEAKLRTQMAVTRGRITADTRKSYQDVRRAETARNVAQADLDLAREQVSVDLAQMQEGRVMLVQVEQARFIEDEKWLAFYDAEHALERARLALLKQTGTILAALK